MKMVNLAGFEPATFCLEDRRSDSAELQARNLVQRPTSNVQCPKSVRKFLDVGHWTLNFGRIELVPKEGLKPSTSGL
jgi:hypothetical protein